jgi:hypothetical protein
MTSGLISSSCRQCGAELSPGETCRERFERCLAHDYERPGTYGLVHHLVVACYMLQHNGYSRPAWLAARQMVAQAVGQGLPPATLRAQNRRRLDSGRRSWRVTRGEKMAGVEAISWSRTIADVRLETAEAYQADVRAWAESVLADTEELVGGLAGTRDG